MVDQDTTSGSNSPLATQHPAAYAAAVELIAAGVPIFTAPPQPLTSDEFKLPIGWQQSIPDVAVLSRWQPGDALAAVMGHTLDLIDLDPRNGAAQGYQQMVEMDLLPTVLAEARTPQGGVHYFVSALGCASLNWMSRDGKTSGIAPGVDYKGGTAEGTGRGFAYIAPTVRKGGTYTWPMPPDHDYIAAEAGAHEPLIEHINRGRAAHVASTATFAASNPFDIPTRLFTRAQAKAYCDAPYEAFRSMRTPQDYGFNAALNELAVLWGHFVPEFITKSQAAAHIMVAAIANRSVEFQGEAGVRATILSGLGRGMAEPYQRSDVPVEVMVEEITPNGILTEFLTATQLQDMPNPEPLINGVLDLDTTAWMIGRPGTYKSFIALDMLGHVALGKPWHGYPVRQGRGAYIVAEGVRGTKLRTAAWERTYGALDDTVLFLPRPVQVRDAGAWDALVAALVVIAPSFVVIDTQSRVSIGLKENDNTEMMVYVNAADAIRRATQACVLSLHHQGRAGLDARGASAIDGAQDTELRIERDTDRHVIIHQDKQKDADDTATIELDLVRSEGGIDMTTGRDLSSLVVITANPLNRVVIRDWIDNLAPNQAALIGVFADFVPNVGGTKAEVRKLINERLPEDHKMANASFARAWDALVTGGHITRVTGTQRWLWVPISFPTP